MKCILFFAAVLLMACFGKSPEKTGMEGKTLPDFSLQTPDSTTWINTSSLARGRPMVFFLFSVRCPYCKSQLSKFIDEWEAVKGFPIYMITAESYGDMKQFYSVNQLSQYPNIKMGRDTAGFFGKYMSVTGIPFLALYDKDKKLVKAFMGPTNPHLIKAVLSD